MVTTRVDSLASMARKKSTGWFPKQHGAWAMIIVPYITGLVLASNLRPLDWGDLTLGLAWLVGYFAFNSAVLWLKSPAKRRASYQPALLTYLGLAAVFGLATLLLKGPGILIWAPAYAVVLGIALWLAASKRERSILSGVLTVVASCGLMAVLRPWPANDPTRWAHLAIIVIVTAYFVGTVFHVKALIRERNDPSSARRSVVYHVALLAIICAALAAGWITWPWVVWGCALLARAYLMPRRAWKPAPIGIVEIVASAALLVLIVVP